MKNTLRLFGTFSKVTKQDDGSLIVEGIASSETVDSDGEVVKADAMRGALPDFMKFANVREMHQPIAAGKAIDCHVDDAGLTHISAHIIDEGSCKKVVSGVLQGFSIGGRATKRSSENAKHIEGLKLSEISLVDRPANPDALITLFKMDSGDAPDHSADAHAASAAAHADSAHAATDPAHHAAAAASHAHARDMHKAASEHHQASGAASGADLAAHHDRAAQRHDDDHKMHAHAAEDHASKAAQAADIKKGMYEVSRAAQICADLEQLASSAKWEASYEGDESPLVGRLQSACAEMCSILRELAAEETAEMVAGHDVEMAAKIGSLRKNVKLVEFARAPVSKSGAKFSSATKDAIAEIHKCVKDAHEKLGALGYDKTTGDEPEDQKSAKAGDIVKMESLEKRAADAEARATLAEKLCSDAGDVMKAAMEREAAIVADLENARVELAKKGSLRAVPIDKTSDTGAAAKPVVAKSESDPAATALDVIKLAQTQPFALRGIR